MKPLDTSLRTMGLVALVLLLAGCRERVVDYPVEEVDSDGDGYAVGEDCDDSDPGIHPGAAEICDGLDDDCDGLVDDADPDLTGAPTWYADADGDGFGDDATAYEACEEGAASVGGDCDDRDPAFHPGAEEVCTDPNDYDCDGVVAYADRDGDGWAACEDCDDEDAAVHPGAVEVCDGLDDDCDPSTSEAGMVTWFPDDGAPEDWSTVLRGAPAEVILDDDGELHLCEGTWSALLTVGADVGIVGHEAVLDGAGAGSVIQVVGDGLTVQVAGLTIQNGSGSGVDSYSTRAGGGIACAGTATSLTVEDAVLQYNDAFEGGGLASDGCSVELDSVEVLENTADYGSGLFLLGAPTHIVDSLLQGNGAEAHAGGAVYVHGTETEFAVDIEDSAVVGNSGGSGGAFFVLTRGAPLGLEIFGSVLEENSGTTGGAVALSPWEGQIDVTLQDSEVIGNTAMYGGAFSLGVEPDAISTVTVLDSVVTGNVASEDGGAFWAMSGAHIACQATADGATVIAGNAATLGGGLYEEGPEWDAVTDEILASDNCDWGTEAAGDENERDDLDLCHTTPEGMVGVDKGCHHVRYLFGSGATFSCTDGVCGSRQEAATIGEVAGTPGSQLAFGDVFEATGPVTLDSIGFYLGLSETSYVYLYLLARDPSCGDWTVEWSTFRFQSAGIDWVGGTDWSMGEPLREGTTYALVAGVKTSTTVVTPYAATLTPELGGLGSFVGTWYDPTFSATYSGTVADHSTSSSTPWAMEAVFYAP